MKNWLYTEETHLVNFIISNIKLEDYDRELLISRYVNKLKYCDICEMFSKPLHQIKGRLRVLRNKNENINIVQFKRDFKLNEIINKL